jgi:hypothetical protein
MDAMGCFNGLFVGYIFASNSSFPSFSVGNPDREEDFDRPAVIPEDRNRESRNLVLTLT